MRFALGAALVLSLTGCMVLSHDTYFSPSSAQDHELRSPFPGNPWNEFTVFGAPADIITIDLTSARIGISVRTSASSFAWVGPVFVPIIPIPANETLVTEELQIWLAVKATQAVEIAPDRIRIRLPDDAEAISVASVQRSAVTAEPLAPIQVAADAATVRYLGFELPEDARPETFTLEVDVIQSDTGVLSPVQVEFSRVRGWRALSLP